MRRLPTELNLQPAIKRADEAAYLCWLNSVRHCNPLSPGYIFSYVLEQTDYSIRHTLRSSGSPEDTEELDTALARELAYSLAVRAVNKRFPPLPRHARVQTNPQRAIAALDFLNTRLANAQRDCGVRVPAIPAHRVGSVARSGFPLVLAPRMHDLASRDEPELTVGYGSLAATDADVVLHWCCTEPYGQRHATELASVRRTDVASLYEL